MDTVTLNIPLFIRLLEHCREDVQSDADLHRVVERTFAANQATGVLTMANYDSIVSPKAEASVITLGKPSAYSMTYVDRVLVTLHRRGVQKPSKQQLENLVEELTIPSNISDDVMSELRRHFCV